MKAAMPLFTGSPDFGLVTAAGQSRISLFENAGWQGLSADLSAAELPV